MSPFDDCPCANCAGAGADVACEKCGAADKPLDKEGYCPKCSEQIREWETTQLSLTRHIEAWRQGHGLTVVETLDTMEWLLMLGDEQLTAAMQGEDVFADGK